MTTTCHLSLSIDGFAAGPDQCLADPIGVGGGRLHAWLLAADEPGHEGDAQIRDDLARRRGAVVMGRNMFGPVREEWETTWVGAADGETGADWNGWWGNEPPYHAPVFVLTHYARESIEMGGGTTFFFITDGFDSAYAQALAASDNGDVHIAGGAGTVRQALRAGVVDELVVDISPVMLGSGVRLFEDLPGVAFEPVEAIHSPLATHIRYRVSRA